MTSHPIRSMMSYSLYFALLAIVAFWVYYQTLDIHTASTLASAGVATQTTETASWLGGTHVWLSGHAQPLVETARAVKTGMSAAVK